jgi:hypothetical protein
MITDDFNRANSSDLGSAWDAGYSAGFGNCQIVSNVVRAGALDVESAESNNSESLTADQWAQVTLSSFPASLGSGNVQIGVILRAATPPTCTMYWIVADSRSSGNNVIIRKRVAGVESSIFSAVQTWASGDILRAEIHGTELDVFRNGVHIVRTSDSSISSGRPGLYFYVNSANSLSDGELDNFQAGSRISYFGSASVPVDGAAAANATTTLTITPPASMAAGDLVVVLCQSLASATWSNGVTGGQTWNALTAYNGTAGPYCRYFWCRFNGTWAASPRFDSTSATSTMAIMHVFRPYDSSYVWAIDVAQGTTNFAAPSSPFTVTRAGVSTVHGDAVVMASWHSLDDNTWGANSSNDHWLESGSAQYRNTSGTDQSVAFCHAITVGTGAGFTFGNVSKNQDTLGGDAGVTAIVAWYAAAGGAALTKSLADGLTLSDVRSGAAAFPAASNALTMAEVFARAVGFHRPIIELLTLGELVTPAIQAGLMSGLVSYWKLDEASGTRADSHGPNPLADNNTVLNASGKISNAADFEINNSEYLSATDNGTLRGGNTDFTIGCWVYAESLVDYNVPFSKGWGGASPEYILYTDAGNWSFVIQSAAGVDQPGVISGTAAATGVWQFVVCWHDSVNDQICIQINNGTVVSVDHAEGVAVGSAPFALGASIASTLYWDGLIDEAFFYRRVLSPAERTSLDNSGAGLSYPFTAGGALTKNVFDGLSLGESRSGAASFARSFPNALTINEALGRLAQYQRYSADLLTLADSIAAARALIRAFVDPLPVSEALAKKAGKGFADALTLAEALAKQLARGLADPLTVGEVLAKQAQFRRSYADLLTLSESVSKQATAGLTFSDPLALTEAFAKFLGSKSLSDVILLNETLKKQSNKGLVDLFSLSETLVKFFGKNVANVISLNEALAKSVGKNIADPIAMGEALARQKQIGKAIAETLAMGEVLAKVFTGLRSLVDPIVMGETVSKQILGAASRSLADAIIMVGNAFVQMQSVRAFADSLILSEAGSSRRSSTCDG